MICATIGIPNANNNIVSKKDLNIALRNHDMKKILEKFGKYRKLDNILGDDPTKPKDYMMDKSLADSRMIFRIRTEILDMKDNMKDNMRNKYKGTSINCEACDNNKAESQSHVMVCPGYAELRVGKDMRRDQDLVSYFREVLILREKRKSKK